jgi:hypothetical protein
MYSKYKSGNDFVKAAEQSPNVVSIRYGKGDHVVIKAKNGESIVVPMHDEIATGLRHKLIKIFMAAGILGLIIACVIIPLFSA